MFLFGKGKEHKDNSTRVTFTEEGTSFRDI